MKKRTTVILLLSMALLLVGLSATMIYFLSEENAQNNPKRKTVNAAGLQTFADVTEVEAFQSLPIFEADGAKMTEPKDRGDKVYMVTVNGTSKEQYKAYLKTLQEAGFEFFADNGEDGLDEAVYTSSFTSEGVGVTVTYIVNEETTYITASQTLEFSPYLKYDESRVKNSISGKKTTLYMYELYNFGNSFVLQLKNGHFLVSDGGTSDDIKYLLDYLESMTPEGEIPIVEGWFISHAHGDHHSALGSLAKNPSLLERVRIDGIYMSIPNAEVLQGTNTTGVMTTVMMIQTLPTMSKNAEGGSTKIYRPQTGQKYYFSDVVVEIPHTQEQLLTAAYANYDLNDSSTWTMFRIEGQKVLICGDADVGSMRRVMRTYDASYFNLDMFASFHHNLNNWLTFLEYCEDIKTTLFTASGIVSQSTAGEINSPGANAWLVENSDEYYSWRDGGVAFTFPYTIGTGEKLPKQEWKYHEERVRDSHLVPEMYY